MRRPALVRTKFCAIAAGLLAGVAGAIHWRAGLHAQEAAAKAPSAPAVLPGSDWPMYRHDPALSAASPLRGGLAEAPRVAWSVDLGGPRVAAESIVVRDVTGDGQDEFLIVTSDAVSCRDSRGRQLWKLDDFLRPTIDDVRDFAGDGSRGILLTTTRGGKVDTYMVNGRTGKATRLWRNENNFGGHARIGRLLPDFAGLQIAATASGQTPPAAPGGDIRLVSFAEGLDSPRFHVRQHVEGVIYSPIFLFADLAGDGHPQMVVVSHEQIWAFDPRTGEQSFYAAYGPAIRTYWGTVAAVKLQPQDRSPALVMINPHLPGLRAVSQDGKTFARELWKVVIGGSEDQYQKRISIDPTGPGLVYDLENNGRFVIFAAIKNEHGDGQARLVVFDARSGERLAELPEAQVLAVDDLDGDGRPEVLLRRGSELHIARWAAGDLQTVWHETDVLPVLRPLPSEGDLALTSGNSAATRGNVTVWREQPGTSEFLLRFPDGVHSCRLGPGGLEKGEMLTVHEALGNLPAPPESPERIVWDGAKLVTIAEGKEVYRYEPPSPVTYLAPPPLVADLAGKRRILVRDAAGNYLAVSADGQKEGVFLEHAYDTPQLLVDPTATGPVICDLDGDGENDMVATVADTEGRPSCVVLDGNGKEKWRLELLPGMTALNRGPTGSLGPGQGRWLLLRMSGEGPDHERKYLVAAYDGKSGKQLWVRADYGRYGANPVVALAHFPSAVVDYNDDGVDDWLICSENFYGIIDVKENQDLVGPVVLSDALPGHWTAYTFPALAPLREKEKPVVVHHNAYSMALVTDLEGRPLWHFGLQRDTASTWGQFADLDGDGQREILHVQPDGLLRCFNADPSARCPTCPAGTLSAGEKEASNHEQQTSERWQFDVGRPVSRMIAADLDGDGRMEVVFGGDDGNLHALGEREGRPKMLWSVALGRRVGEPILVDLDGDGRPEILVTAEDGRLYCLKRN